jgi:aminopeptidase
MTPIQDVVFDQHISGAFYFTGGQADPDADNGVYSSVSLGMVMIQTPEYGGGAISFDGKLMRQDGHFILPELAGLNPEKLLSGVA